MSDEKSIPIYVTHPEPCKCVHCTRKEGSTELTSMNRLSQNIWNACHGKDLVDCQDEIIYHIKELYHCIYDQNTKIKEMIVPVDTAKLKAKAIVTSKYKCSCEHPGVGKDWGCAQAGEYASPTSICICCCHQPKQTDISHSGARPNY